MMGGAPERNNSNQRQLQLHSSWLGVREGGVKQGEEASPKVRQPCDKPWSSQAPYKVMAFGETMIPLMNISAVERNHNFVTLRGSECNSQVLFCMGTYYLKTEIPWGLRIGITTIQGA